MIPVLRTVLFACSLSLMAQAQGPSAVRILALDVSAFPQITMHVDVRVQGRVVPFLNASHFIVSEEGRSQTMDFVSCPRDSTIRLSIAILLDRSLSMGQSTTSPPNPDSTKLEVAKQAIRGFLGILDARDEVALMSFSSEDFSSIPYFTVDRNFTFDHSSISAALVPLRAHGGTRLWDALHDLLPQLATRVGRRIGLVITDGVSAQDRVSDQSRVIAEYRQAGIPLYIIGLGADVAPEILRSTASATGGRFYYSPTASELEAMLRHAAEDFIGDACVLRYVSTDPCHRGGRRMINVTVTQQATMLEVDTAYLAPSATDSMTMAVGDGQDAVAGQDVLVPIMLVNPLSTQYPAFVGAVFQWDASILTLDAIVTDGTMAEGSVPSREGRGPGRERVDIAAFVPIVSLGPVFYLRFRSRAVLDTVRIPIRVDSVAVMQTCPFVLTSRSGSILLRPCIESYTLGGGTTTAIPMGRDVFIPLRCSPPLPMGRVWDMDLDIISPLPLEGVELDDGIAQASTSFERRGYDIWRLRTSGIVTRDVATPVVFRGRALADKEARRDSLRLSDAQMSIQCAGILTMRSIPVEMDGQCDRIVRPRRRLEAWPRPAHTDLWVSGGGEGQIRLRDVLGRIWRSSDPMELLHWDISAVPNGLYVVEWEGPPVTIPILRGY